MKRLSEFLTDYINQRMNTLSIHISLIESGIEMYKKHLKEDSPKTVQWAMVEKRLITALEKMESSCHFDKLKQQCNHKWVLRIDGYEEQCEPAICCLCGLYGCWCDAKWREMTDEQQKAFKENGINGNNHELKKRLKIEH